MKFIDWLNTNSGNFYEEFLKTTIVIGSVMAAIILGGIAS